MIKALKQISDVQMGYPFRSRLEFIKDGTLAVIQMKDLGSDNRVDCNSVQKIEMEAIDDKHLVQKGDIIFRSRGVTNTAVILDKEPKSAIVAAPLLRIRVDKNIILPEYLCWYINQNKAQNFLKMRQEGTHGGMISRQTLETLPVDLPSLDVQRQIIDIINLHEREQILEKKRLKIKEQYMNALLLQLIKGDEDHGKE